ncbi:MAG: molybdate ABC transporter permease subunit [Limnothrix sp. BL-A-16]
MTSLASGVTQWDWSPWSLSVGAALWATGLAVSLGLLIAWAMLSCREPWRSAIDTVLVLPLVLPPTVVGFGLLVLLGRQGPIGLALESIGVSVVFSPLGTVVAATVVAFPLAYRTLLSTFEQLDPDLLRAARTLGLNGWQIFWRVRLPLARSGLVAAALLTFARSLGEFGATVMLAGNIPGRTQTIPSAIFAAVEAGDWPRAQLWVWLSLAMALLAIVGLNQAARRPW